MVEGVGAVVALILGTRGASRGGRGRMAKGGRQVISEDPSSSCTFYATVDFNVWRVGVGVGILA